MARNPETHNDMEQLKTIKELIDQGHVDEALVAIEHLLSTDLATKDEAYYLRGNAYRKQGDWKQAIDNYQLAIDINPNSPATQARAMAINILEFFHKDMYNQ